MEKEKHAGGRPLKFKTPEEILKKAQVYFDKCINNFTPITITGLALALKTSRETLMNYEKRDKFFDAIKEVKLVCENYAEQRLFGTTPTGAIFALKNYGWKDKQEHDHTSKGEAIGVIVLPQKNVDTLETDNETS
jgi:hypothetical protein